MARILMFAVILVVLAVGSILAASELGGEVAVLRTYDESDSAFETSVWIVDDGVGLWLRGGNPESSWVKRLETNPMVEIDRAGETLRYRAEIVPEQRERVERLMAENYGFANDIVGLIHDKDAIVPIMLDELP